MNRTWLRWQSRIHSWLYKTSQGRIGRNFGAPVLLLTTIGRKSGKARTNPLFYLAKGGYWAVVASNAGSDRQPAWWLNLQAAHDAIIQVGNMQFSVTGREASKQEHAELWPQFVEMFDGYETYRQSTNRPIPVIILEA